MNIPNNKRRFLRFPSPEGAHSAITLGASQSVRRRSLERDHPPTLPALHVDESRNSMACLVVVRDHEPQVGEIAIWHESRGHSQEVEIKRVEKLGNALWKIAFVFNP